MLDVQENRLQELRNRYSGRVFILGNGPSLLEQDLAPLQDEHTFVCNSFFRWAEAPFTPTFYAANWFEWNEGRVAPMPDSSWITSGLCFLLNSGLEDTRPSPEWIQAYKCDYQPWMIPEFAGLKAPLRRIPSSATSPLVMGCLAIWMGFRELYFLGVEQTHGYTYALDEQRHMLGSAVFMDRMQGQRWKRLGRYFRQHGVRIADCTPGGGLNRLLGYTPLEQIIEVKERATV